MKKKKLHFSIFVKVALSFSMTLRHCIYTKKKKKIICLKWNFDKFVNTEELRA